MLDYRNILRVSSDPDKSIRTMELELRSSHHTIRKVQEAAQKAGISCPLPDTVTNHCGKQRASAVPAKKRAGTDRTDRKDAAVMGNRKLPFGYQMCMGEIVRHESEAKAVQEIFLQYALGASLKEIAIHMGKTGPAYDVGKSWNKNMVARILENNKYTGTEHYPR